MTTVSFDLLSAMIGLICGIFGVIVGNGMRRLSHSVLFLRDPFFIFFCCLGWIVMIVLGETDKVPFFASGIWNFMMVCFILGYVLGFTLCNPRDNIEVDLPEEGGGSNSVMLVYYVHNGNVYMMPQAFMPICKAIINVRYPLDINLNAAKNGRSVSVSTKIRKIRTIAYPVALHIPTPITIGKVSIKPKKMVDEFGREYHKERWLFNFYAEEHKMRFSQATIEDPLRFWRQSEAFLSAIGHSVEVSEKYTRLQVDMQTMKYEAAADMVIGLVDMNIDANNFRADLFKRMNDEMKRRTDKKDQTGGEQYANADEFQQTPAV